MSPSFSQGWDLVGLEPAQAWCMLPSVVFVSLPVLKKETSWVRQLAQWMIALSIPRAEDSSSVLSIHIG